LGEHVPVGDRLVRVGRAPFRDDVRDVRDPGTEDERQAHGLDRLPVAAETIPASATTVTSSKWCAVWNAWIVGSMVDVSALFP
jgi:hypothetical protein